MEKDMICIGVQRHLILEFLNREGCGYDSFYDTEDGRCPVCRGWLTKKFLQNEISNSKE